MKVTNRKTTLTPWMFNGRLLESPPENALGFCYIITHKESGLFYVGKKQFWTTRSKPRVLKNGLTSLTQRVWTNHESNWAKYRSSSEEVKALIRRDGIGAFSFEVLSIHGDKMSLTVGEVAWQFKKDVLIDPLALNRNIAGRYYKIADPLMNL